MQFSDTINKNGLIQVCESLCRLGDGGISNNATLLKQFVNYINIAVGEVRSAMLQVDHTWKSDDYNYTNYPDAPISFVADQSDYELPVAATGNNLATLLRVSGVYILSGNERVYLRPMTNDEPRSSNNGSPTAFRFHGKSIWFDCEPDSTFVTNYTRFYVEFQRLDEPFASTDTTQQPGFIGTYHHLLGFRASALYMIAPEPQTAQLFNSEFLRGVENLKASVSSMNNTESAQFTSEPISFR